MALSTAERVKQTFNLRALRHEAKAHLTGRQWEKRGELVERCAKSRQKAEELNFKRYPMRVGVVQKKLIDEAGSKTREYKPFSEKNDRFDKSATLYLAQQDVRQAHERRIAQINQYEERGLSNLMTEAKRENQLQGKAERAFDRTVDRRHVQDRHQSQSRKRSR